MLHRRDWLVSTFEDKLEEYALPEVCMYVRTCYQKYIHTTYNVMLLTSFSVLYTRREREQGVLNYPGEHIL